MSYREEFPDYDDELIIPDGWEDNSWHNDACPSIMTEYRTDNKWCEIFQDYKDQDMRECPSRYALYLHDESKGRFNYEIIDSDDFNHLLKIANEYMTKAIQEDADRMKRMMALYEVK